MIVRQSLSRRRSFLSAGAWTTSRSGSGIPLLKGSRLFTFEELKKSTNNFAEASILGTGSYGKVTIFVPRLLKDPCSLSCSTTADSFSLDFSSLAGLQRIAGRWETSRSEKSSGGIFARWS